MNNTLRKEEVKAVRISDIARTKYQRVPVQDLYYGGYQRGLRSTWVGRIAKDFKEGLLGVLIVSYRDGKYYVVDGQHRLEAAKRVGVEDVICQVHTGLTYEEEADLFREYNKQRKGLSAHDLFKAALESKDPMAMDIMHLVEKYDFRLPLYSCKLDNHITATAAVQDIYKRIGSEGFERLLKLLRDTWDGERSSLERNFMNGLGLFIKLHNEEFDDEEFVKKLGKIPPEEILREGRLDAKYSTASKTMTPYAKVIWYNYNKGKQEQSKLPNKF